MNKKELQAAYESRKASAEIYKELFSTAITQVKFNSMQVSFFKNILDEIKALTDDDLIIKIVENAIERNMIDRQCQTRVIFGKDPKGLK